MRLAILPLVLFAAACAASQAETPPVAGKGMAAPIVNTSGKTIGKATFTASPKGVLIHVQVDAGGLKPGWHGLHLHAVGDCSDHAGGFEHAKAHVKTGQASHGLLNPSGPEEGDLPNISAAKDGSAAAELFSSLTTMAALQDADGSALLIHANPDDHTTQPIGGAGDRVACAMVPK